RIPMEDPGSHETGERQVHLFIVEPTPGEREPAAFPHPFHCRAGRGNTDRLFCDLRIDLDSGLFPDPTASGRGEWFYCKGRALFEHGTAVDSDVGNSRVPVLYILVKAMAGEVGDGPVPPARNLFFYDCPYLSCSHTRPDHADRRFEGLAGRFKEEPVVPEIDRGRSVRDIAVNLHPEIELDHVPFGKDPLVTRRCRVVRCIFV